MKRLSLVLVAMVSAVVLGSSPVKADPPTKTLYTFTGTSTFYDPNTNDVAVVNYTFTETYQYSVSKSGEFHWRLTITVEGSGHGFYHPDVSYTVKDQLVKEENGRFNDGNTKYELTVKDNFTIKCSVHSGDYHVKFVQHIVVTPSGNVNQSFENN